MDLVGTRGTYNQLGARILEINKNNGWNVTAPESWGEQYKIPSIIALIHSEITELFRSLELSDTNNAREELADIIIRCLDCMAGMRIDIDGAMTQLYLDSITQR